MARIAFKHLLAATAVVGIGAPAAAAEKAPDNQQERIVVGRDGKQLICKAEKFTGSRIRRESCATAEEWKEFERR